jgi:Na+-transporting NADH:ubiquinone oxidoreductase subunit F
MRRQLKKNIRLPMGSQRKHSPQCTKEEEELHLNGPYGDFYRRESERDILLIATGSGLASIKSILDQIEREQILRKNTVFFGARTPEDLCYFEELKPTLSQAK